MPSQNETGHAKNVANFKRVISFCVSCADKYNPSKEALKLNNLQIKLQQAEQAMKEIKEAERNFNSATNQRMDTFRPLRKLSTRVVNALSSTEATAETIKDAVTINRKIQGTRAKAIKEEKPVDENAAIPPDKTISVSQQSYDQRIEHFDKLLTLVSAEVKYTPNETDLQVDALQSNLNDFNLTNQNVIDSYSLFVKQRNERDDILYNPLTGLVKIASDIKKYIISVYTAASPEFKQVNSIEFRTLLGK